jgi:hypothetical protein
MMEKDAHPMKQGIAYWQNLESWYTEILIRPRRSVSLRGKYMWLFADEAVFADPMANVAAKRGDLMSFGVSWNLRTGLGGHLLYEHFRPGSFYDYLPGSIYPDGAKDARFFRIEISKSL